MEGTGFSPADYEGEDVEVWPENYAALNTFSRVSTQWRVGTGGAIGLDYNALYPLLDRLGLTDAEWLHALDDIRVMESAALTAMNTKN